MSRFAVWVTSIIVVLCSSNLAACPTQIGDAWDGLVSTATGPGGGTGNLIVYFSGSESDCTWSVSTADPWFTLQGPTTGSLDSSSVTLNYSMTANSGSVPRQTSLTISLNGTAVQTIDYIENSNSCTYSVTPTEVNIPAGGASGFYTVTGTPNNCYAFYSVSPPNTPNYTPAMFGPGTYTIYPNSLGPRSWTITFGASNNPQAGPTLTINQAGTAQGLTVLCTPATGPQGVNAYSSDPYLTACTASGGTPPYAWSIAAGTLPTGLVLQASGTTATIQGVSTIPGPYQYTIQATDSSSPQETGSFLFAGVQPAVPLSVTFPGSLPSYVNSSFSTVGTVQGGTPPYHWSVSGILPESVNILQSGNQFILSGFLNVAGPCSYTIQVQDSSTPPYVQSQTYTGVACCHGTAGNHQYRRRNIELRCNVGGFVVVSGCQLWHGDLVRPRADELYGQRHGARRRNLPNFDLARCERRRSIGHNTGHSSRKQLRAVGAGASEHSGLYGRSAAGDSRSYGVEWRVYNDALDGVVRSAQRILAECDSNNWDFGDRRERCCGY